MAAVGVVLITVEVAAELLDAFDFLHAYKS
jgi:hypothetical protein